MRLTRTKLSLVTTGLVGTALIGAVGADAVIGGSAPPPPPPNAFRLAPGTERVDARTNDPVGGPPWAVRVYQGQSGLSCLEVGRFDGRAFGPTRPDGTVADLPIEESGSCGDLDADVIQFGVVSLSRRANAGQGERTVLFGRASDSVRTLRVRRANQSGAVSIGARGTFIIVLTGLEEPTSIRLRAELDDGSSRDFALGQQ